MKVCSRLFQFFGSGEGIMRFFSSARLLTVSACFFLVVASNVSRHLVSFLKVNKIVTLTLLIWIPMWTRAEVKLPAIFSDHMVLQRDIQIPVWGWAGPGEEVTVTFGRQNAKTITDRDGRWKVYLEKTGANATSQVLTVSGKNIRLNSSTFWWATSGFARGNPTWVSIWENATMLARKFQKQMTLY